MIATVARLPLRLERTLHDARTRETRRTALAAVALLALLACVFGGCALSKKIATDIAACGTAEIVKAVNATQA